ncbi:MAG: hypothetical protein J7M03_07330 [Candidatus Desulfofervidaceae bacterium]|nr:hypothetical protein [Candidatus Desulfofervidaceae bacterium]MDL1969562.1 hypothetical protein [Candidatus Desulfofervidaceae bacterium]
MTDTLGSPVKLCAVCAWREFCKKKFSIQSEPGSFRCPDFVYDVSLKEKKKEEKVKAEEKECEAGD